MDVCSSHVPAYKHILMLKDALELSVTAVADSPSTWGEPASHRKGPGRQLDLEGELFCDCDPPVHFTLCQSLTLYLIDRSSQQTRSLEAVATCKASDLVKCILLAAWLRRCGPVQKDPAGTSEIMSAMVYASGSVLLVVLMSASTCQAQGYTPQVLHLPLHHVACIPLPVDSVVLCGMSFCHQAEMVEIYADTHHRTV